MFVLVHVREDAEGREKEACVCLYLCMLEKMQKEGRKKRVCVCLYLCMLERCRRKEESICTCTCEFGMHSSNSLLRGCMQVEGLYTQKNHEYYYKTILSFRKHQ